ncbi:MAG TPA: PHP domain-containing protein, partial [Ramlibacter sp.]|nr:PHP domain-containing protein [Ramlibacter sp.]
MPEQPQKSLQQTPADDDDLPPALAAHEGPLPRYAELHCITNFSFQRGASHPHELVQRAYNLGYEALAITDECSVSGVVQALVGLKDHLQEAARLEADDPGTRRVRPFKLMPGSEFALPGGRVVALARNLFGWGDMCQFITAARMQAPKGEYCVSWEASDWSLLAGCERIWAPDRDAPDAMDLQALCAGLRQAREHLGERLWLGVALPGELGDELWLDLLRQAGAQVGVPLVATCGVVMHKRSRKNLHDVITAVREGKSVAECG